MVYLLKEIWPVVIVRYSPFKKGHLPRFRLAALGGSRKILGNLVCMTENVPDIGGALTSKDLVAERNHHSKSRDAVPSKGCVSWDLG